MAFLTGLVFRLSIILSRLFYACKFINLFQKPSVPRQAAQLVTEGESTREEKAVLFNEVPGYLFLKTLGVGAFGSASLVRSCLDGKLYVRKEDRRWSYQPRAQSNPPQEIINARIVQHLPGVYKACGWTRWIHQHNEFDVTYWQYCDLGCLNSILSTTKRTQQPIPEIWIISWLMTMIDTLTDIHKAEIVHKDAHGGNWLLQSSDTGGPPLLILGDFGLSAHKNQLSRREWAAACAKDFKCALQIICDIYYLEYNRARGSLVWGFSQSTISPRFQELLGRLMTILHDSSWCDNLLHSQVSTVRDELSRYVSKQEIVHSHPAAVPEAVDLDFLDYDRAMHVVGKRRNAGFKQWSVGYVRGDEIEMTRSFMGVAAVQYPGGDWYDLEWLDGRSEAGVVELKPRWKVHTREG